MCEWKAEYRQQRDPSMQFAVDKKQWGFIDGAGGAAILANQSWLAWLAAPCWPEEKDANKNLILTGGNLDDIWESSWVQSNHYWRKAAFQALLALLSSTVYSVPCFVVAAGPWWPSSKIQSTVHCILPTVQWREVRQAIIWNLLAGIHPCCCGHPMSSNCTLLVFISNLPAIES